MADSKWLNFARVAGKRQSNAAVDGRKHCLLMDEVDGMAGNEDRGGVQVSYDQCSSCSI